MEIIRTGRHFKLLKEDELPALLDALSRYLPESLKFHQTLKTYLNNPVWNFHFYIANSWPQDPICLHFPGITICKGSDLYESVGIFCPLERSDCLQLLLNEDILINWTKSVYVHYVHSILMGRLEQIYVNTGIVMNKVYGDYYISRNNIPEDNTINTSSPSFITKDVNFREIRKEDAKLIHDLYPANDIECLSVFENLIQQLPAFGVYSKGELVSWMMQSYYGAMFSMHTRYDHRRLGYGVYIARYLTKLVKARGYIPFVVVRVDNYVSQGIYSKLGFSKLYCNVRGIMRPYTQL